jgi:hypothetical protein
VVWTDTEHDDTELVGFTGFRISRGTVSVGLLFVKGKRPILAGAELTFSFDCCFFFRLNLFSLRKSLFGAVSGTKSKKHTLSI